jgi:hypothetical protein
MRRPISERWRRGGGLRCSVPSFGPVCVGARAEVWGRRPTLFDDLMMRAASARELLITLGITGITPLAQNSFFRPIRFVFGRTCCRAADREFLVVGYGPKRKGDASPAANEGLDDR